MGKPSQGFTLLEVLIGLAIMAILAAAAVPSMSAVMNKHALKVKVSRLDTYVSQARNLAAFTECPVQIKIERAQTKVNVKIRVIQHNFWKGCTAWHSQNGNNSELDFPAALENVELTPNSTALDFGAKSGMLNSTSGNNLKLKYRNSTATIKFVGIGNGVVTYE